MEVFVERFRQAVEALDPDALEASLAADVVFRSPIVHRPFSGRPYVGAVLRAVMRVLSDFRYVAELGGDGLTALVFEARIGNREVEGIDLGRVNDAGEVSELRVFVRPLSAAHALRDAVGRELGGLDASGSGQPAPPGDGG